MKKHLAYYAVFLTLAFALSYLELLFPIPAPTPGIKLGLANLVVLVLLYHPTMHFAPAGILTLALTRTVLAAFLFGTGVSAFYGICGTLLSFFVMLLAKKLHFFGLLGVSVLGGVCHNIGQLFAAGLVLQTATVTAYLPVLLLSGTLAGAAIGAVAGVIVKRLSV